MDVDCGLGVGVTGGCSGMIDFEVRGEFEGGWYDGRIGRRGGRGEKSGICDERAKRGREMLDVAIARSQMSSSRFFASREKDYILLPRFSPPLTYAGAGLFVYNGEVVRYEPVESGHLCE